MEETFDHHDTHDTLAGAAAAAAGEALGELAGEKSKYGSLPSWNIVVLGTVGGILFFELICHQMNHAAAGKRHAQELLETLYRELAILGIVAFILWAINVSPAVDIEYGDKHFFEQIHMALFLAALLHTFFVGVVALYSRQTDRRWDIFEDDEMRRYKDLKQQHRRTAQMLGIRHASLKQGIGWCRATWLAVRHPILYRRLSELSEHVGYHAIRTEFIRSNKLPKNFRFASYLKKCEQSVVLNLAGIKESVWVAMVLFVGAELFIKGLFGQAKSSEDVKPMFITGAVIVMATAIAVHIKLKSIYTTIIHSYQATTDRRDEYMQFVSPETNALSRHKEFFWFSSPGFMVLALQVVQFLLAIMVGALIWFGRTDSTGLMVIAEVILGVGAFGIYTIVLPRFIPKFTTVTHVGGLVNRHILSECLVKQKKAFQHRALPPTLRQVSVMARVKADNEALYGGGGVKAWLGKTMSGHAWRQFLQVLITIHFFVVAYNTDPVEKGRDTDEAFWIELCLGCAALLFEIVGFFVVWKGQGFFRFSFFTAPRKYPAAGGDNTSASVYPSHSQSRQNLLEDGKGGKDATVTQEPTGAGSQKQLLSGPNKGGTMAVDGNDYGDTRCSLWACFGWNGLDRAKRFFGVPPSARVGWWRTIDFVLVLAVAACSITTFSVDWDYRVVHACQGLVILRWLPLLRCPLRPAPGHADLHDVGGATVHDQPLDNNTRHKVLQETLGLLRGQNKLAAMVDRNMAQDDGADLTSAFSAAGHTMLRKGSIAEEKEDGDDGEAGDIANVGVAVALREACAAHPELVQSHGPLSAPILRAMLGLDPHKNGEGHNDVQDFNVTAKAVALARGFQRADSSVAGDAATPGRANLRRQSSRAGRGAPPSPARRSNSSSSSELSSSEEEGERLARKGSNASHTVRASRARVSSWIGRGGSRHSRTSEASQSYQQHQHQQHMMFQQQQQQLMYQQQQQMQLHYQLQQQQRASQQDLMSSMEGGGTAAAGMPLHTGPLVPQMPHGYMGAPYAGVGAVGAYGLAAPLPMPSFDHPSASGGGGGGFSGSSHSRSKPVRRGRSRSSRHRRSGHSGDVVVPPAVEDIERPVLRSFASDAGSQHGGGGLHSAAGTPRAGAAGLSIPFGSGRSIPFSSSHRAARSGPKERGTPGRATAAARHQHRRSLSQGGGPDSGGESDILGRAATEAVEATVATASASTSSQQGLDMVVPGSSDATVEGSAASGGEEGSATPAVGKSAAGSAFAGKDGKAE